MTRTLPRVRFTVRRMMVAVAIVAIGLPPGMACARRRERSSDHAFRMLDHSIRAMEYNGTPTCFPGSRVEINPRKAAHHEALARKYEWALRYPFLPVWPDPPEPE
jgi:hypothetical protein